MPEKHAWNETLDVGHEAMDHEHHMQIALVSAFVDALEQRRPAMARKLADQLLEYSQVHFGSEQLLMENSGYPEREAHALEHEAFLGQMRELKRAFQAGEEDLATTTALDLRNALGCHMADADRRLAAHASRS
jgi:hemerythrin